MDITSHDQVIPRKKEVEEPEKVDYVQANAEYEEELRQKRRKLEQQQQQQQQNS